MEFLYTLIPILTCTATLYLYKRGREEPVLIYLPVPIVLFTILIMSLIMRHYNFQDIEYRSYYYTKVRHYDEWKERQQRTRTVKVGDKTRTEVYYVTVRHPEKWTVFDNGGKEKDCKEIDYNTLRALWKTPETFVDMHRFLPVKDGDAQEYPFCGHWEHMRGYTEEHPYENRILGSENVMKFKKISDEEADSLGLYHYSTACLMGSGSEMGRQKIEYLNAKYGKEKQIHIKVLVFPAWRGPSIVEDQRAYWQGGNKNELVICIGATSGRVVKWAEAFSWQDNPELDVRCKEWIMEKGVLDFVGLGNMIEENLGLWKRKEFEDFSYIGTYLTTTQNISILIVTICITFLSLVFVIGRLEDNR